MNSREKILEAVKRNQPAEVELPSLPGESGMGMLGSDVRNVDVLALAQRFTELVTAIGGAVYTVTGYGPMARILHEQFPDAKRIVSNCPELGERPFGDNGPVVELNQEYADPHTLEDIDLSILRAHFGVAENGACWITEDCMIHRVVPFICQHLILVLDKENIVANMHAAYDRIAEYTASGGSYGFATFIAGPSKTADIEQSLVLGAHGPRSLTVFLVDGGMSDAGFY